MDTTQPPKRCLLALTTALLTLAVGVPAAFGATGTAAAAPAPQLGICAKARDPQRCEALQAAKETCKDIAAADKRKCMADAMPPMDCAKSRNPARCDLYQQAKEACKEKTGPAFRQCMRANTPKGGKGKA